MAARISEVAVDDTLRVLIEADVQITDQRIEAIALSPDNTVLVRRVSAGSRAQTQYMNHTLN